MSSDVPGQLTGPERTVWPSTRRANRRDRKAWRITATGTGTAIGTGTAGPGVVSHGSSGAPRTASPEDNPADRWISRPMTRWTE